MKRFMGIGCMFLSGIATTMMAQEPEWNAANVKECDRACLVGLMDAYITSPTRSKVRWPFRPASRFRAGMRWWLSV